MKVGGLVTLLLAFAATGCATQRLVAFESTSHPQEGVRVLHYDAASLDVRGHMRSGTMVILYEANADVTRSRFTLDCRLRRVQFPWTSVERAGRVISVDRSRGRRIQIATGTIASSLADNVCAPVSPR